MEPKKKIKPKKNKLRKKTVEKPTLLSPELMPEMSILTMTDYLTEMKT